jgi:hypothetical protein
MNSSQSSFPSLPSPRAASRSPELFPVVSFPDHDEFHSIEDIEAAYDGTGDHGYPEAEIQVVDEDEV